MNPKTPCWAVVQVGYGIYGVGKTQIAAVADAGIWLKDTPKRIDDFDSDDEHRDGSLALVPIASKLCTDVLHGGDPQHYESHTDGGGRTYLSSVREETDGTVKE